MKLSLTQLHVKLKFTFTAIEVSDKIDTIY